MSRKGVYMSDEPMSSPAVCVPFLVSILAKRLCGVLAVCALVRFAFAWVHQRKNRSTDFAVGRYWTVCACKKAVVGGLLRGNRLFTAKRFALYNLVLTQEEQKDYGSNY